jgi:thioredoxin-dependent peroxiredoxin
LQQLITHDLQTFLFFISLINFIFESLKETIMAKITLKGNPVNTIGELPRIGEQLKNFSLVRSDLSKATLDDFKGQQLILNIFPSLDTGTCAASVRYFNKAAAGLKNTRVLCISRDLPFAQKRFCGAEGIENVITLSDFATGEFGRNYGLLITDGPLQSLLSRVVIIADESGKIIYTEQVPEISQEPDYAKALEACH